MSERLNHKGQTPSEAYGEFMGQIAAFRKADRRKWRACFWSWPWGHDYNERGMCTKCYLGWPGRD